MLLTDKNGRKLSKKKSIELGKARSSNKTDICVDFTACFNEINILVSIVLTALMFILILYGTKFFLRKFADVLTYVFHFLFVLNLKKFRLLS